MEGNAERPDVFDHVVNTCAHVVLAPRQTKEVGPHILRAAGIRFPQQEVPLFRELEDRDKLKMVRHQSKIRQFSSKVAKVFRRRGHADVTDDMHLYEVAASVGAVVITSDENLLKRSGDLKKQTGVTTCSPADL